MPRGESPQQFSVIALAGWRDMATASHLMMLQKKMGPVEQSMADADCDGAGNTKCLERG